MVWGMLMFIIAFQNAMVKLVELNTPQLIVSDQILILDFLLMILKLGLILGPVLMP